MTLPPEMQSKDTIFALASAPGRAGVSVMRVSGPRTMEVTQALIKGSVPAARRASLRTLYNPKSGHPIDQALLLCFEGPASFTGEDMTEFQVHGSPAVIEGLASALYGLGLREAERGEFTRRAFENDRMDLTEAEGLADLIDAETEAQRAQAYRQMAGGLRDTYEGWREDLLDALAAIEGEIDFPDEEDVPDKLAQRAGPGLDSLIQTLSSALEDGAQGERIRHGLDIAIIGPPNAGKSTIINALTNKDASIVSDEAGTTRDIVEVGMVIAGLPVRLSDTAGLRDAENKVEVEGVRRASLRARDADLRIGVIDASDGDALLETLPYLQAGDILVLNKSDLGVPNVSRETLEPMSVLSLSAQSPKGIATLHERLEAIVSTRFNVSEDAGLTRARHKDCVTRARDSLVNARHNLSVAPELAGEDMRAALHAIKELAGETDIEAVLGRIFSRFCIGK